MSIKIKLVSCISAFILVLGIFIFGVLSAEQATVNLGGSISFEATDVYARVTGRVQNAQDNPTLETLEFSAYNDTPDQSSWSGLELRFDSRATNITIEVTVENLSMERELTVNLTDMIQISTDNLGKSITLDNGAYVSGTNTTVPAATSNDENNTSKVTFVITFDVLDHNRSLQSTTFDYDINLMDENYEPVYEILEGFSFNDNGVLLSYTGNESNVVIPSSYSIIGVEDKSLEFASFDELNNWMSNNAPVFYSMLNFTVLVDDISYGPYPDFTTASSDDAFMVAMQNATQSIIFEYQENIYVVGQEYTVTGIGLVAFVNNNNLQSITIPDGVTSIGEAAFSNCSSLTSITIPDGVTNIGSSAFSYCSSLTSITIPESVTTIGLRSFYKCTNLTEINYNATLGSDCAEHSRPFDYAGQNGNGITVNVGANVKHIPAYLFDNAGNSFILEVHFAEGSQLETIGSSAFGLCDKLTSITIPDSVTSIGTYAFSYCSSLTSINIPEGVASIGSSAFNGCSSLTSIEVDPANTTYSSEDGVVFNKDKTTLIICPGGRTGSYSIPDSVTSIGNYAFNGCSSLTSITIPEGVTSIGDSAFYFCNSLTSINIPEGVTSIGDDAFWDCNSLTSITIPEGVTSIGAGAFSYCNRLNDVTVESDDIYLALTSQSACGDLIHSVNATGETVRVLKSVVDNFDPDFTKNTYLNNRSRFTRSVSEDGRYYVYTHI